jgi:hypothetical protein
MESSEVTNSQGNTTWKRFGVHRLSSARPARTCKTCLASILRIAAHRPSWQAQLPSPVSSILGFEAVRQGWWRVHRSIPWVSPWRYGRNDHRGGSLTLSLSLYPLFYLAAAACHAARPTACCKGNEAITNMSFQFHHILGRDDASVLYAPCPPITYPESR